MRVQVVDPSAFTPPYDHALCSALAAAGVQVSLITSRFSYGAIPAPDGYARRELFYRRSHRMAARPGRTGAGQAGTGQAGAGQAGTGRTGARPVPALAVKLAEHVPDMLRQRRLAASADLVHYQWLTVPELDGLLLPRRRRGPGAAAGRSRRPALVLTAHDVMPRQPRPGQLRAQRRLYDRFDAIVVHTRHGRDRLTGQLGLPADRVHVIPHGVLTHLAQGGAAAGGPHGQQGPIVLFFGLLRPYKGLDVLLEAWRTLTPAERAGAQLWIVGMPRMDLSALGLAGAGTNAGTSTKATVGTSTKATAGTSTKATVGASTKATAGASTEAGTGTPPDVHLVPRFIDDSELPSFFEQADLVVLPYREADQSGVLFTALAFGAPLLLSDVGGFPEIARTGAAHTVPAGDTAALAGALRTLLADPARRERMAGAARALAAPGGEHSWQSIAARHIDLYERLLR